MNNITKKIAFTAVIGAAALLLHTSNGREALSGVVGAAGLETATLSSVSGSAKAKPRSTAIVAGMGMAVDSFGPEQAPYDADTPVGVDPLTADVVGTASAPQVRSAENMTPAQKRQLAESKMSGPVAALARAGGQREADLIVSYDEHPELFEDGRIESLGGEIVRHYDVLKLLAVRLPAESLVELAIEDNVDRVSLDAPVAATSRSSRKAAKSPVLPSNNATFKGSNIGIAVLDSGVANHTDIAADVRQYSFLDGAYPQPVFKGEEIGSYNDSGRGDGYGHGTHVAGIIAGNGVGSLGKFQGPASGSKILSLKVLDGNGQGSMSDVMAALDWLLQYGSYFDVRVANLSLGKPITESNTTDPLVLAVEQLWDSGIVVAVAAGNYGREGYFSITSPGNSRKIITVGSLTDNNTGVDYSDDYVSTYSSRGPTAGDHVSKPDLVAPGNRLVAASPKDSYLELLLPELVVPCSIEDVCDDNYMTMSGTSMATPLVAAAAAMMLEKDPTLSPATVKARLMRSAQKLDESPVIGGAGLLDMEAAMDETAVVTGEALSPLLVYDEATGGTLMEDTSELWGNEVWGAGYMWTDSSVSANGALWTDGGVSANGFIWTDGGVNANGYIWTDGSIWAHGALWTDGGVAAFGYNWTDGGVNANGYIWTDGGVDANGYIWTDGLRSLSLWDLNSANPAMNDDAQPTDDAG